MTQNQGFGTRPVSNTGSFSQNRFSVGVDWLTETVALTDRSPEEFKAMVKELCALFDTEYEWDDNHPLIRGQEYVDHVLTPSGVLAGITAGNPIKDEPRRGIVVIPGRAWKSVDKVTWLNVFRLLSDFGTEATRIDTFIDDGDKALSREVIGDAIRRRCARSVKKAPLVFDELNPDDWTQYIGSRSSDKFVRIYNKEAESKGEIPAIRLEVESKGKKAREVSARLKAIATRILKKSEKQDAIAFQFDGEIIDMVTGALDFREPKEGEKNYSRRTRCEFWEKFINDLLAEPDYPVVKRIKPALEDTDAWISKQVMPSLTVLRLAYGKKGFDKLIEDGIDENKHKLSPYKKSVIKQYHKEKFRRVNTAA
jgi:hypothetical protein